MKIDPSKIAISVITYFELFYGVTKSNNPEKNHRALKDFISSFEILNWTENDAKASGKVRADLEKSGKRIC
jgi:tRNA(fMet)-specific endonuclease VapC